MSLGPRVAVADGFTQLVAHVFAHVLLEQPGNLYDSRYVAWAREHFAAQMLAALEHDAALIGRCWRNDGRLDVLHGMFELHGDLDAFRRTAARPLAEIDAKEVRSPELLAVLCSMLRPRPEPGALPAKLGGHASSSIAELLHTTLALIADDFAAVLDGLALQLESARVQVEPLVRRLAVVIPGFEHDRVELVWALGMHGRAFTDRILVGAPAAWCGCSPARQAVLAAHEHSVRASEADDYLGSEWEALVTLARAMQRVDDVALREAHASWLAEIDLDELLRGAVARGWLSHDDALALLDHSPSRARWLAHADLLNPANTSGSFPQN